MDFLSPFFNSLVPAGGLVLGPAPEPQMVARPFDLATSSGAGAFTIAGTVAPGSAITGEISFHYDLYSTDPNDPVNFDPDSIVALDQTLSASFSVDAVPEPSTVIMVGFAVMLLAGRAISRGLRSGRREARNAGACALEVQV
jgi:hypothetical protein